MSFLITHRGHKVYPAHLAPDDFDIEDIAHSLSNINRYIGHTREPYSVAEHSVHVSFLVPKEFAMIGLLHDAHEAYVGDVNRPLKIDLQDYREIERSAEVALSLAFGLGWPWPMCVFDADNEVGRNEMRDLLPHSPDVNYEVNTYIDLRKPWPWEVAKRAFMDRYILLKEVIAKGKIAEVLAYG
jgi:hypothetical protein